MINFITQFNNPRDMFLSAVAVIGAILYAITVHEFAHGYVAKLNGDFTAELKGRLTFNPIKHFDIIGFLMLLIIGFGWAKPVPVNPNNFRNLRKGMFTVAIAGVTANLITAIISAIMLGVVGAIYNSVTVTNADILGMLLFLLKLFFVISISLNIILMVLNLLPLYPLDGFRVIESFTRHDNKYIVFMRSYGIYILFGILIIGNITGYNPIFMYINFVATKLEALLRALYPNIIS